MSMTMFYVLEPLFYLSLNVLILTKDLLESSDRLDRHSLPLFRQLRNKDAEFIQLLRPEAGSGHSC